MPVLWIYAGLYTIPADKPAPSSALLALLAKNDEIGPIFFSYNADNKLLYLNAPTANVDITPVVLRQKIKELHREDGQHLQPLERQGVEIARRRS